VPGEKESRADMSAILFDGEPETLFRKGAKLTGLE
jgi:hypothetical protein